MGGAKYRGVFSTVGDIMSTMGNNLEYCGVFSTVGIHEYHGGYLEFCGDVQHRGGYHDARGGISWILWWCSVPWGDTILWNLSTVGDIMLHVGDIMSTLGVFSTMGYSNNKRFSPRYWTPSMVLMISPTCIMISPTLLNTPTVLKISPTFIMISPTVLNTPQYSRYPPRYSWYPPWYWTPTTVLHTNYTGW